jgi:hypothetical protein
VKETKEDINKCKDIPCSWIGGFNTVKMSIIDKSTVSVQFLSKYQ